MAFKVSYRKPNITRVVAKIVAAILGLYVGGEIITQLGSVMVNTTSPFYTGLKLIGWTVGTNTLTNGTAGCLTGCGQTIESGCEAAAMTGAANCITSTAGTGILAVIGIVAIASVVLEFVKVRM